ncbi:MAG: divalent metal cation transporter, partial [Hansschlegelia sp.]
MSDIAQGASTSPLGGWRGLPGGASLADVNGSVSVGGRTGLRRLLAFVGPGYLVAVGYMDPGNWATSLAGGSKFGYALMAVVALSSMMAMLLQ